MIRSSQMGFDSEVMGSSITWSSSSMQHRSRGCTCIVLKDGEEKKKAYLKARWTLHVETRNLSATKTFVRSLASVYTMQNADKDERERKRKRERKKGNCGIGGYGSGKPTPTAESVAPPCAVRLGHCPTRICRGRCGLCTVQWPTRCSYFRLFYFEWRRRGCCCVLGEGFKEGFQVQVQNFNFSL
jgi:hypothetical protein